MERDISQCGKTFGITEIDVLVTNVAGYTHRQIFLGPTGLDWFIHDLEYALTGSAAGLEQLIELMQFSNWLIEIAGEQQERDERAQLHLATKDGLRPGQ